MIVGMERKLASIRTISSITPIENADAIEALHIDGWTVVAQKQMGYTAGQPVVYFEPDSFLSMDDDRFAFLSERGTRVNTGGVEGHVLRTIRLRGTYSEGMVLPLETFPEVNGLPVGSDVTELLGVSKWEPPIPAQLAGDVFGLFPGWMRKTDAERVQNLADMFPLGGEWFATEKIDGTSATYAISPDGEFVVCSRNLHLKPNGTTYWKIAEKLSIEETLRKFFTPGHPVVIQGEIFGEGIQKNPLRMKGQEFRFFNFTVGDPFGFNLLQAIYPGELLPVPTVPLGLPEGPAEALKQVDGLESLVSPGRQAEGVVWWGGNEKPWKAINQKFLSKEK